MFNLGYVPLPRGFSTLAIHSGQEPENWNSLAVVTPIVTSTIFKQIAPGESKEFYYARYNNPTRGALEKCLASLEGSKYALTFSSGMGTQSALMGLFKSGDHLIIGDDIYGGTISFMSNVMTQYGMEVSFVDTRDIDAVEKAIKSTTKLLWIESPTNPTQKVMDIRALARVTKKYKIIFAIDNSSLTPYLQRPLELGADLSVYSLSKYMNGHSDVIMGAIMTNNKTFYNKLKFSQYSTGCIPAPFDCFQMLRGLKTLPVRMRQHSLNGFTVARFLEGHPKVRKVLHPGLPSHPQHELFKSQTCGHSSSLSFYIKGDLGSSKRFLGALKIFSLAVSFGGYESLAQLPIKMTHADVPAEQLQRSQIDNSLIRLSVGLEDVEDLIADLQQALDAC